jgi:Chitobiase/beta-hexosaminidase C-terminal domain
MSSLLYRQKGLLALALACIVQLAFMDGCSSGGNPTSAPNATAATPTLTPASGTSFSSTLSVSITDATPAATIYYTTDGSAPTTSSSAYSGPITIKASTTVNAIASATGFSQSAAGSATYTLRVLRPRQPRRPSLPPVEPASHPR